MGHPTNIFSPTPSENWLCAICADVLRDACITECGHTFCSNCIKTSLESSNTCPNCRIKVSGYTPNYFARDTVDELQVLCLRDGAPSEDDSNDDGSNKKRKRDDTNCCNWKGPLKDLKRHEDNECGYKTVTCSIVGCEHTCLRKDMENHLSGGAGLITHMTLMQKDYDKKMKQMEQKIKSVEQKCDTKIAKMQSECEEQIKNSEDQTQQLRYIHQCRNWIENKPDALSDSSVFTVKAHKWRSKIGGLLCYIPGPTGSTWEGARIPMSLVYGGGVEKPPKCKFERDFFHMNVFPSGYIWNSTLAEENGWTPEMTLPEILFTIQQVLCHPNPNCPEQRPAYDVRANGGNEAYHRREREEADKYKNFTGHHSSVAAMFDSECVVDDMEIGKRAERYGKESCSGFRSASALFQKDSNDNCECSCCVLGQSLWDSKKKMRFLFG